MINKVSPGLVLMKAIINQRWDGLLDKLYPPTLVQMTSDQWDQIMGYVAGSWKPPHEWTKILGLWPVTHLTFRLPGAVYLGHREA